MNLQEQNEKLRKSLSTESTPDSLTPDQIKKQLRLKNTLPHKRRNLFRVFAPCAAAIFLISMIPLMHHISSFTNTAKMDTTESKQFAKNQLTNQSYLDIYSAISQSFNESSKEIASSNEDTETEGIKDDSNFLYSKTNIQSIGIEEADVVKTDGQYLYLISNNQLLIIKVKGKNLSQSVKIPPNGDENQLQELYLSGNKLVLLETAYTDSYETQTMIRTFDITSPLKPRVLSCLTQQGGYESSRLTNDFLYTFSKYEITDTPVKNKPETYVPAVNSKTLEASCILLPEQKKGTTYLVVTALSLNKPSEFHDQKGILTQSNIYYVSETSIYIAELLFADQNSNINRTRITKLPYANGNFSAISSGIVAGSVLNSFSMDEYENHLRVVTTVEQFSKDSASNQHNSLYILDASMKKTGSLTNLASGEQIYSARFMGKTGYFVTFRQVDPLFSVDLSNPASPVLLGKLKIPGLSDYLHFYDDNLLLGIGRNVNKNGQTNGLKLSMFDIRDPANVKELSHTILKDYDNASALHEHRDVLFYKEKNIFGFSAEHYGNDTSSYKKNYLLFTYTKKSGFSTLLSVSGSRKEDNLIPYIRGIAINNYLYLISSGHRIDVYGLNSFKKLSDYSLNE